MPKNPYAPPSTDVADIPCSGPPRVRPRQIVFAAFLFWSGFVGSLLGAYLTASRSEYGFHPVVIALTAALVAFAAVLNLLIYRGHNWARIVTLILTLNSLPMYFVPMDGPIPPSTTETVTNVVVLLLEVAALYLVFTKPGALWFKPSIP